MAKTNTLIFIEFMSVPTGLDLYSGTDKMEGRVLS